VGERSDGTRCLAPPWTLSGNTDFAERDAPRQGEHSREIQRQAGFDAQAIDALVDARIVTVSLC
jgi:crotonobetainyl-CoA:carnitine CoA-transferase CaiB-like acyl-CoA transferase